MPRHLRLSPASTTASVPHHTPTAPKSSPRISALLQRIQAKPSELSPSEVLQLQRAVGNREVARLLENVNVQENGALLAPTPVNPGMPPIQRTIETAAEALFKDPNVKKDVTANHLNKNFAKEHGIDPKTDLEEIKTKVRQLRVKEAARILRKEKSLKNLDKLKGNDLKVYKLDPKDLEDVKNAFTLLVNSERPIGEVLGEQFKKELPNESSGVKFDQDNIEVHLDNYQLKHQPEGSQFIIGTRLVSGGTLFKEKYATESWHISHTLKHMWEWANKLEGLEEGKVVQHGQMKNIDGIHYEGSCILIKGRKYVLFHCYPHPGSEYDSGKKK